MVDREEPACEITVTPAPSTPSKSRGYRGHKRIQADDTEPETRGKGIS